MDKSSKNQSHEKSNSYPSINWFPHLAFFPSVHDSRSDCETLDESRGGEDYEKGKGTFSSIEGSSVAQKETKEQEA